MSKPIDDGGPVHPIEEGKNYFHIGVTLRDYFAGLAMQGWLSTFGPTDAHPQGDQSLASASYAVADAMIAERKKHE